MADASRQSESAVTAIHVMVGPGPSLFLLGGIIFANFYLFLRQAQGETREKIVARSAAD